MFATRARFTASTIRRASAKFRASGFSQSIALPAPRGRDRHLGMGIVRRANVDDVDRWVGHDRFPIVTALSQPSFFAARHGPSAIRPQIAAIRISAGKSKKRGACRQALEWARPMNLVPMSATESVRRFGMLAEHRRSMPAPAGFNREQAKSLFGAQMEILFLCP